MMDISIPLDARIYVAGHSGLVGSAIVRRLVAEGFTRILTASRQELDLLDQAAVLDWFERQRPEFVFLAAGRVGGILANLTRPGEFIYDNLLIPASIVHASYRCGVRKLLYLGSSCIYPRDCPQPIREEYLLSGALEPTNEPYAVAKIAGIKLCQAYRQQFGCNFISAMPTNLYGPGDNFDPASSHVVPALIERFHAAKLAEQPMVTVWGTGTAHRELLHVDDLSDACVFLMRHYDSAAPINVGTGVDLSIRDLAELVRQIVYPAAQIQFDSTKPDGVPRKLLDVTRLRQLGWSHQIELRAGIESTYRWYAEHASADRSAMPRPPVVTQPGTAIAQPAAATEPIAPVAQIAAVPTPSPRRALITGITGQDGSYLAELLLAKGYEVCGVVRRSSSFNTGRIDHIYQDPHEPNVRLRLVHGDLCDASSINRILKTFRPDEIYNLGAQSHVKVSFDIPEYTAEATGLGAIRLLEAMRELGLQAKIYQASSSELYGMAAEVPQRETTPFHPRSPYAAAKAYAFYVTRNYREAYGMFAVNGILFNHESPRRGETFVTRKITRAVARIARGMQQRLYLGNLDARRDWGYAADYVDAMWRMLQAERPDDYVIATGQSHSVREFCERAFAAVDLPLRWLGQGVEERGIGPAGQVLVEIDPRYFRPAEVDDLCGDYSKARRELGWVPRTSFDELVRMMVAADLTLIGRTLINADQH